MKILSIDIAAFGGLKNYRFVPREGLNVIFGENEEGKTTLMHFVLMMFYGSSGKKQEPSSNPRKKYRPISGDVMAGSISFAHQGRHYRIDRQFGASNTTDKITLTDLDMGTAEAVSGSICLGEKFFGLSEAAFKKSIFVTDSIPSAKSEAADGELNTRMAGIIETGDEDASFEEVTARLKKARETLLSKSGRIGSTDKAKARLQQIDAELAQCVEAEEELAHLLTEEAQKQAELKEASLSGAKLFEDLKGLDKIKKRGFVKQFIEAFRAVEELEANLKLTDGGTADEAWTEKGYALIADASAAIALAQQTKEQAHQAGEKAQALNIPAHKADTSKAAELEKRIARIDEMLSTENTKNKGRILRPLLVIYGILFIAAAVILYLMNYSLFGTASAGLGVVLALVRILIKSTKNRKALDALLAEKQTLLEQYTEEKQRIIKIEQQAAASAAMAEQVKAELEEKLRTAVAAEDNANRLSHIMKAHFGALSPVADCAAARQLADRVGRDITSLEGWKRQLVLAQRHSSCDTPEEAEARLAAYDAEGIPDAEVQGSEALGDMVKAKTRQTAELKAQLVALQLQIKETTEEAGKAEILRRTREELAVKIEKSEEFCRQIDTALQALDEAFRQYRRNYSGRLDQRAAEILHFLTEGRYKSVSVSKNFEVGVTSGEVFGQLSTDILSRGTADQVYLALRLAMAELLGSDDPLPLLLDDPLDRYDDGRAHRALEFLKSYGQDRQVILFTCHSYIADMAKALNINIKDFKEDQL